MMQWLASSEGASKRTNPCNSMFMFRRIRRSIPRIPLSGIDCFQHRWAFSPLLENRGRRTVLNNSDLVSSVPAPSQSSRLPGASSSEREKSTPIGAAGSAESGLLGTLPAIAQSCPVLLGMGAQVLGAPGPVAPPTGRGANR